MNDKLGVCDACGARFKIPAAFRSNRARCRECGGVVRIGEGAAVARPSSSRTSVQRGGARARTDELPDRPADEVTPTAARAPASALAAGASLPSSTFESSALSSAAPVDAPLAPPPKQARAARVGSATKSSAAAGERSPAKPRARRRGLVALVVTTAVVIVLGIVAWRTWNSEAPSAHAAPTGEVPLPPHAGDAGSR